MVTRRLVIDIRTARECARAAKRDLRCDPSWGTLVIKRLMSGFIVSIKPRYIDLILSGLKVVELRKRNARLPPGARILLYATAPRCAVVGETRVTFRDELTTELLWKRHGVSAAVSRAEFNAYYDGAGSGVALGLAEVICYGTSLPLSSLRDAHGGFAPPQSYMRVPSAIDALVREHLGNRPREYAHPGGSVGGSHSASRLRPPG